MEFLGFSPVFFPLMDGHDETVFYPFTHAVEDDSGLTHKHMPDLPLSPILLSQESPVSSPLYCDEVLDHGAIEEQSAPATPVPRVLFASSGSWDMVGLGSFRGKGKIARERRRAKMLKELEFENPGKKAYAPVAVRR